jgi:hypothetical protein
VSGTTKKESDMGIKLRSLSRGTNCHCVEIGTTKLYFSYETLVAVDVGPFDLYVRENEWGPTTGRHLNDIAGDYPRLPAAEFEAALKEKAPIIWTLMGGVLE